MRRVSPLAAAGAAMLATAAPALCAPASGTQSRPDLYGRGASSQPQSGTSDGKHYQEHPRSGKDLPAGPDATLVADDRAPGSLLLFPEFDNTSDGVVSLLTVTNTDYSSGSDVDVEFIYIDETNCSEFNRTETLTENDTLSLITNFHNPQIERGYVYVFAKDNSGPIVWNALIGHQLIVDGLTTFDYGVNPVTFLGIGDAGGAVQPDGTPTDLDGDGNQDLDGAEYAQAPAEFLVPRFLGQSMDTGTHLHSQLILIALSGGSAFSTRVDFLIYNDNEEVFSSEYEFECWDKPRLLDISGLFANNFLANNTNDDPDEIFGWTDRESGWFRVDGGVANSNAEAILDPAFYCVLIERMNYHGVADLPFSIGGQDNGALLPHHILGDGDPTPVNGDGQ